MSKQHAACPPESIWKWIRVDSNGCWIWTGLVTSRGYGKVTSNKRTVATHRLFYEWFVGPIPEGMCVCHKCDVRRCVNPVHLFLGTQLDNIRDAMAKDRDPSGERNGRARLTTMQVKEIRCKYSAGHTTLAKLAEQYGTPMQNVSRIVRRELWRNVK